MGILFFYIVSNHQLIKKLTFMKSIIYILMLLSTTIFFAQDQSEKKFAFEGSIDTYFRTNLTAPNDTNQIAPATSFADTAGFSLGMANIIAS